MLLCLAASSLRQPAPATTLLDLYASGEFDAVASILGDRKNFDELLAATTRRPADAGGPQIALTRALRGDRRPEAARGRRVAGLEIPSASYGQLPAAGLAHVARAAG